MKLIITGISRLVSTGKSEITSLSAEFCELTMADEIILEFIKRNNIQFEINIKDVGVWVKGKSKSPLLK